MKITCLGPDGSYSYLAAKKLCPNNEILLCATFSQAVGELVRGEADGVVLPIENTIQGGVLQNLDLMQKSADLYAVKEYILPIDHRLAMREGATLSDIKKVFSHQQALSQCSDFLNEKLPMANLIATDSTAESLNKIVDNSCAGIVGAHVKREGIVVSDMPISNESSNFTHFLLLKKGREHLNEHSEKIFFSATCLHRPGALLRLLQVMYVYDLNLTKIESRPIKETPGEYRFFIEFLGDIANWKVKKAIEDIKAECSDFKLLGVY